MKYLIVFAALLTLSVDASQGSTNLISSSNQVIEKHTVVKGVLKEGGSQSYFIETNDSHFIFGEVKQVDVDVKIQVFDPTGTEILAFNETQVAFEPFTFDTQMSGQYKVLLTAADKSSSGAYTIQLMRNEAIAVNTSKRLEQLLSPFNKKTTPGAVIGVFEKGEVKHTHSVGMANLAHNIPFKAEMPTNIGSVSKQFTAMAMLLLEQQGKVSLDEDIRNYLPELPEFSEAITIRNVLTHTSGLREIFNLLGMRGWQGEDFIEKHQAVEIVKKQPELQFAPGEKMNYNNTGFILLAIIVERVTDQGFAEWMRSNIFEPLDMKNTYVRRDPGHIIPSATQGYALDENGFREAGDLYSAPGAGGMYTTVADMAKWSQNYITGRLGGKSVISKLTTPGRLNDGTEQTYALGLGVSKHNGLLRFSHGGGDMAHFTRYAYFPEVERGLFLNTNNTAFNMGIWRKVVDLVVGKYYPESVEGEENKGKEKSLRLSPEYLAKLAGKYSSELLGATLDIKAVDGSLKMAFTGGDAQPLIALSETEFTYNEGQYTLTFMMQGGEVSTISFNTGANDYEFNKLELFEPTTEQLNEYSGRYFSEELEVLYTIAMNEENKLTVKLYTTPASELVPLQQDVFSETNTLYTDLHFIRDENGKVTKIELNNGRTQGVMFERMP